MSYDDKAGRVSYSLPAATISGAATTYQIKGPAGRRARLASITGVVTTTTVGTPAIQVGVSGSLSKFGSLSVGPLTAPNSASTETGTRNAATGTIEVSDVDQTILVTVTAGTSGVVSPNLTLEWF